jgi:hypothetical protein
LDELRQRVEDQIHTFLPCFPAGNVEINITPTKLCNILITIDDVLYTYDSAEAPVPISIDSAASIM